MNQSQSNIRHFLYVAAAVLTTAIGMYHSVDFTDPNQVVGFALNIALSGVVTSRSYIDKSASEVLKPEEL